MKKLLSLSIIAILITAFGVYDSFAQTTKTKRAKTQKKIKKAPSQEKIPNVPANSIEKNITTDSALLYKISGNNLNKPSYIFGTIHLICPADLFPKEKLKSYLDQTEQLFLEIDLDSAEENKLMTSNMLLKDGKTIKDFLNEEKYQQVDKAFKQNLGISVDMVKDYKPFLLQVMLAANGLSLACQPPTAYEVELLNMAKEKQMPLEGLERVSEQFGFFEKIPLQDQFETLYELSKMPQKPIDDFKKLYQVYKSQNSEELFKEVERQTESDKNFMPILLIERNKNWIPKMEKAMVEKPTFFGVGGGHLSGDYGVITLLKQKGYKVEAIKL